LPTLGRFLSHLRSFKFTPEIGVWTADFFGHFFYQLAAMSVGGLRVEDRLAGAGNWSPWKARIVLILEGELWDIVESHVVPPIDAVLLVEFRKRNIKAKRTILDVVKDHIIPHVSGKDFAFQI
jgi:hypothetical protein